ncbi:MAG: hypothetical protein RLZZ450_3700 [Pseudomonadota bacterium]|jgi:alcohol dehydrogenase
MRQLTCTGPHQLAWLDVPEPVLQADTDALVRPLAVARCDIDRALIAGAFQQRGAFAVGHECVAEVISLGDSVQHLALGQQVVVPFQLSCGECPACRAGHSAVCAAYPILSDYGMMPLSGVEYGGMLSDVVRVPFASAMLQPVPRGLDPVALASVSDNVVDGFRAVAPHLSTHPGSEVLIVSHGSPSIPLYAVQAALALGASRVDFACKIEEELALAEKLGARVIRTDFVKRADQYPIVIDAGATREGIAYSIASTAPAGTLQVVGVYPGETALPLMKMYTRGMRVEIGRCHASAEVPRALPLIASGKLRPQEVTTRVVSWEDAVEAYKEPAIKLVLSRGAQVARL